MKKITFLALVSLTCILASCSKRKLEEKGFQVNTISETEGEEENDGINKDSLKFDTQPSNVLLTGVSDVRLTTIYKVNVNKDNRSIFIGSNGYHYNYEESQNTIGNDWNNNLMPGFKAVYGYNMVNISHYNIKENKQKNFFEKPVLIKTLYYPTTPKDTLNKVAIDRDFFMVSVYNEDTNKDGFINPRDLRRFYLFNIQGEKQKALVPDNYSAFKSEYDVDNDFMYVFAQLDQNVNGRRDVAEPIHIFWINLKDPNQTGRLY